MKQTLNILFIVLLLAPLAALHAADTAKLKGKPNILHIHADDHRPDGLRALGNPLLQTPNLDTLVERGMTFTHCYTMDLFPTLADKPEQAAKLAEMTAKLEQEMATRGDRYPLKVANPKPAEWHPPSLNDYRHLVRTETWTEKWPDASGKMETRTVTAEVWTAAMQAALDERKFLHIPAREKPYYIDAPLVLKSCSKLTADPKAEIRLKPGSNTCMVRNERVASFNDRPVPAKTKPDTSITIEGGIWTTLATAVANNGNELGHSSKENPAFGTHGVILLQNVRGVTVKNLTVRKSRPFGVHLANAHEFTVENITLEEHRRDGVHVNGPASDGLIRGVRGDSMDDDVALNAWDWKNYAPSYGPIERIVVEDVTGWPGDEHEGNIAIRVLPGVKRFNDGTTLNCAISDITFRRITDIRHFKIYDQPNIELGRDKDFSVGVGTVKNLRLEDLTFNRLGQIELHANTIGLTVRDVKLNFPVTADFRLIELGPQSETYKKGGPSAPEQWTEIFSPDLDCTVRNLSVSGVRVRDSQADLPIEQVVQVIEQKLNPDYPKTTPRGGVGKGIWIR